MHCIPKIKVEMAPKKLGEVILLSTWEVNFWWWCRPSYVVQWHNCSLEVGIRVTHGVEEILSDDDTTEDTLIIAWAKSRTIRKALDWGNNGVHRRASLLWYKQQSSRRWAEFRSCQSRASFCPLVHFLHDARPALRYRRFFRSSWKSLMFGVGMG